MFGGAVAVGVTVTIFDVLPATGETVEPDLSRDVIGRLGMLVGQVIVLIVAGAIWFSPHRRSIIAWPIATILGVLAMAFWWPLVAGASAAGSFLQRTVTGDWPDPIAHTTLKALLEAPHDVWFWLMIVLAVPVAAVVEEMIYRGILQTSLVKLWGGSGTGRWAAIVATSIIFTGAHAAATGIGGLCTLFVLSIGFGWALERSGRLLVPIIMHATFNGANLMMAFLM
jgi:membrane protease YdiL (CAAX protease family)